MQTFFGFSDLGDLVSARLNNQTDTTGYPHDGRVGLDTGYPHDGRADNAAYRHDRRADKRRYPHDRKIDIQMLNMFRT